MPDTITTYHTFVAATKAKATEVNENFSNYRGTILPINTDTASASDNTHDLGSTDHGWRYGYINNLYMQGSTSTTDFKIVPNTSSTAGSVDFMFGSTTITSLNSSAKFNTPRAYTTAGSDPGLMGVHYNSFSVGTNLSNTASTIYTTGDLTIKGTGFLKFEHLYGMLHTTYATYTSYVRFNYFYGTTLTAMTTLMAFDFFPGASGNYHPVSLMDAYVVSPAAGTYKFRLNAYNPGPTFSVAFNVTGAAYYHIYEK